MCFTNAQSCAGTGTVDCGEQRLRAENRRWSSDCCGRETEIPELSCVDLSVDGGEFGVFRRCLREGEKFDAKFAGAQCCPGLVRAELYSPPTPGVPVDDGGCTTNSPPSTKTCLPCGNRGCDNSENQCNCLSDCSR
jgi:hypothetical protein